MVDSQDGGSKPVMYVCGHDLHIASLLAATEVLSASRKHWQGTLVVLFQPDEETAAGAQAIINDGLYDSSKHDVPKPGVLLDSHCMPERVGTLRTRGGVFNSAADSFEVTIYGSGEHGSRPHTAIDSVIIASGIVLDLQTIVSRESNPLDAVVVTVGAIHAGSAHNIISSEAKLLINTRSFNAESRARIKNSIIRIIKAKCDAFRSPQPPVISELNSFPLLENDPKATSIVSNVFKDMFGSGFDPDAAASMGSEDFTNLAAPISALCCFWSYGWIDSQSWDRAKEAEPPQEVPGNHSALFAPAVKPALRIAIDAWIAAALAHFACPSGTEVQ
ncbi:MAG: hypothetical protein M1828_001186 [Chrysothrix sp. TS-e1954]|nr:MAG: hypothetical protein M1828_001186 [Chrysothrix sp. TS-e1954]